MQAIALMRCGAGIDELNRIKLDAPAIVNSHQVLIKVAYASLNPVDYKLIANQPTFWHYPYIPGLDLAGQVVAIGADVTAVQIGDNVAVHADLSHGGALAEYILQPEHVLFKIPVNFDLRLAAAMPCAGLTAYQALVRKMNIQAGKSIFIQAGSGGVGGFAIIIAKALGLRVISSCSTRNIDYVLSLGADEVFDYTVSDIYSQIKQLCPQGVDYILETTNKVNLQRNLEILAFNGQIASIVGILDTNEIGEFSTGFGFHEVALGGAYLAKHYSSQTDLAQMGNELLELLIRSGVSPQLNEYNFEDYPRAFAALKSSAQPGKIVLKIDQSQNRVY